MFDYFGKTGNLEKLVETFLIFSKFNIDNYNLLLQVLHIFNKTDVFEIWKSYLFFHVQAIGFCFRNAISKKTILKDFPKL